MRRSWGAEVRRFPTSVMGLMALLVALTPASGQGANVDKSTQECVDRIKDMEGRLIERDNQADSVASQVVSIYATVNAMSQQVTSIAKGASALPAAGGAGRDFDGGALALGGALGFFVSGTASLLGWWLGARSRESALRALGASLSADLREIRESQKLLSSPPPQRDDPLVVRRLEGLGETLARIRQDLSKALVAGAPSPPAVDPEVVRALQGINDGLQWMYRHFKALEALSQANAAGIESITSALLRPGSRPPEGRGESPTPHRGPPPPAETQQSRLPPTRLQELGAEVWAAVSRPFTLDATVQAARVRGVAPRVQARWADPDSLGGWQVVSDEETGKSILLYDPETGEAALLPAGSTRYSAYQFDYTFEGAMPTDNFARMAQVAMGRVDESGHYITTAPGQLLS